MRKLSHEFVADYFKDQGCEILDVYVNNRTKVKYRCHCGNVAETLFNDFRIGKRCGCGNKISGLKRRGYTIDQLKEIFKERQCELSELDYKNNKHPMAYICQCGRRSKICLSSFLKGRRCKACGADKNRNPLAQLNYKIKKKCRAALQVTLEATGQRKKTRSRALLGYGVHELRERITTHANWEQVKDKKWHLDHIFPIKAFIEYGITDLKIINALDNLQPLEEYDNLRKKDKYDKVLFEAWLRSKGVVV